MKRIVLVIIINLMLHHNSIGQNLVPNGDFEQYWHCPSLISQIDSTKYWTNPTKATPDYFNQCAPPHLVSVPNNFAGFQQSHSGGAIAGIYLFAANITNYREYIEVPLDSFLTANVCYHFDMYVNLANNFSKYTTGDIGVYFSDTLLLDTLYSTFQFFLPIVPQINNISSNVPDTLNWTLVSGNYTAQGGERFLTIGNFKNDLNTDTININPSCNVPGSYIYIDDVCLTRCGLPSCFTEGNGVTTYYSPKITIFPNPITSSITITSSTNIKEIKVINLLGEVVSASTPAANQSTIDISNLSKGIYFVEITDEKKNVVNRKVVVE